MRRGFLSTPSARRATGKPDIDYSDWTISIHALREEGDVLPNFFDVKGIDFYPRPPRGGRPNLTPITALCLTFLSTPSARRATSINKCLQRIFFYFYPRPPRGGRPGIACLEQSKTTYFYPRPPRGGRLNIWKGASERPNFYPRPPRGGRLVPRGTRARVADFYPRPPRGGRRRR